MKKDKSIKILQEDSWAKVELYRWQYGELPPQNDMCKELNEPIALQKMAEAIEKGCKSGNLKEMPTPFNLFIVLRYISRKIDKNG